METGNEGRGGMTRREAVAAAALLAATGGLPAAAAAKPANRKAGKSLFAYIGTYTPDGVMGAAGHGEGIHMMQLDTTTGALKPVKVFQSASPSWLAFGPEGKYLYAANETKAGAVTAFAVDRASGALSAINTVSAQGAGPAHLSVHPSGKFVFVSNYGGGNNAVLAVQANGGLGDATDVKADEGPPGAGRPADGPPGNFSISDHDGPHGHMIAADPTGKFVLANDLGLDRTLVWKFDLATGKLTPNDPAFVPAASEGAGPRHFVFHPSGRYFYNLYEEASQLAVYDWEASAGTLTLKQKLPTLPRGYAGTNFTSEILITADGRFLYVANRLHNSIAVFAVGADGRVRWLGEEWTRGDYPRHIALDPSGRFIFACNQRSDQVTTFRVDGKTGALRFAGHYVPVGSPAVIVFLA